METKTVDIGFEEGYVIVNNLDDSILENRLFDSKIEAEAVRDEYKKYAPYLDADSHSVVKVTREMLKYGSYPFERQLFLSDAAVLNEAVESFKEYIFNRNASKPKVPEFAEGYVAVDVTDRHVLDNKIFDHEEDALSLMREYLDHQPSLQENSYLAMKVSSNELEYGMFPYDKQMYLTTLLKADYDSVSS